VLSGYCVHSFLVEAIRWAGITYLVYLAYKLIRAALRAGELVVPTGQAGNQFYKGFLTSLLNPKGMMVYVAILPQFMDRHGGNATLQAVVLWAAFLFWCAVMYSAVSLALGRAGRRGLSEPRRRLIDGSAGGMVLIAAGFMALVRQ
jgi:threonine/homoserine/homoserine lactone efflux protein